MTKQKITEVRDDLNRLVDALNPGSPRAAVARAVEKLDAILDSLPAEPEVGISDEQLECLQFITDHPEDLADDEISALHALLADYRRLAGRGAART